MYGLFTRIPSIFRRTIAGIGGDVPDCVIQWVVYSKPIYNETSGFWEFQDKVGTRNGVVLESNCLLGDGIATIQFPVVLASTSFTYFDGTTDQTGNTDVSAQWVIPNTVKVGNIRFETVSPYSNWFLCDEADGFDLFNRVEGGDDASLINASAANWTTDNDFTSFQNEIGYSEGTGDQLIPAQVDTTGKLTSKDALGNSLQHRGQVRLNTKVVNSNVYEFDGFNDSILLDSSLNLGKNFKIYGRFKFNDVTDLSTITDYDTTSTIRFFNGGVTFRINSTSYTIIFGASQSNNVWYNFELTRNGKDISVTLGNLSGSITILEADNIDFLVQYLFTRSINDLSFNGSVSSICLDVNNECILKYNCAEGDGDVAYDSSGNGNHGTIANANLSTFHGLDNGRPDNLLDGFSQKLVCETAGITNIPNTEAYGIKEFIFYKDTASSNIINFVSLNSDASGVGGYQLISTSINNLQLNLRGQAILFNTVNDYIAEKTKYNLKITRNSILNEFIIGAAGTFLVEIKGGSFGADYVPVVVSSGSNPVTNNAVTTSAYFVPSLTIGSYIKDYSINSDYQNLMAATDGTGVYSKVRVPARTSTLDAEGDELSNPSGAWHNNAESEILQYPSNQMFDADSNLSTPYWSDGAGTMVAKSYDDFVTNGGNIENQIDYTLNPLKQILTFEKDARTESPDCFTKALSLVGKNEQLFTNEGLPALDKNGVSLYVLK